MMQGIRLAGWRTRSRSLGTFFRDEASSSSPGWIKKVPRRRTRISVSRCHPTSSCSALFTTACEIGNTEKLSAHLPTYMRAGAIGQTRKLCMSDAHVDM